MSNHPENQPAGSAGVAPTPRRRSTLRLIGLAVIAAAALGYLALQSHRARAQAEVSKKVRELGGSVTYDFQGTRAIEPQGPQWLRSVLGDEYFVTVTEVELAGPKFTDQTLAELVPDLQHLPSLRNVRVVNTAITERGLPNFHNLQQVRQFRFPKSEIEPSALNDLDKALPNAQVFLDLGVP